MRRKDSARRTGYQLAHACGELAQQLNGDGDEHDEHDDNHSDIVRATNFTTIASAVSVLAMLSSEQLDDFEERQQLCAL